ncbi:MAG: DNA polymerase III subunit alpha [Spirochaetes bacterium]|nr:DNA polymerase III subunit alpha [Spirochaetota bacterium]
MNRYIPLNVCSTYSLLYGTAKVEKIAEWAAVNKFRKIALTDRNNLYAVHLFIAACKKHGILPIIGTHVVCEKNSALLYAKNREGFSNINRILSERNLNEKFDLINSLKKNCSGIVVLSEDIELLSEMKKINADVYILVRPDSQKGIYLSDHLKIKPAAAGPCVFLTPEDYEIHKVLRAVHLLKTVSSVLPDECESANSLFITERMALNYYSFFPECLSNSLEISEKCTFSAIFEGFVFPEYNGIRNPENILRERVYKGAEERYGELSETVIERIEYELSIISQKGFCAYFLVVSDIVNKASRTCGRGSGASSIVAYSLRITNVDPVKYDLYFERFLNPQRNDMPDIDIDFAWDERDDILENTINTYGKDYCAMVCTFIHFRGRSSIRDTARAYGIPENEISAVEKKIFRKETAESDEVWEKIIYAAGKIQGFPKHLSVHVGGVVITPQPLSLYVPVERSAKGVNIVTWDKDGVEDAGLVKIDLLGNRSLAVIRDSIENARDNNPEFNLTNWNPADDAKTVNLMAEGNTIGVFYVESPAMRQLQKKTSAGDFDHLVIHSSIIRPAANRFINLYIDRLKGMKYEPIHPVLEYILRETYGIMVYQEDVSKTAVAVAGFSSAEADGLRKILSKRNKAEKLEEYRIQFFKGALKNNLKEDKIREIWEMVKSFDGYSFCKPHSASYAMVSFQSAYMKTYFPAEFMAAVISNGGGYYTVSAYISEAKRMGVEILPPDVNESDYRFRGYSVFIRTGLMAIKTLRYSAASEIISERKKNKFRSLNDLIGRVNLTPSDCEVLINSGALDSISNEYNRPEILWKTLNLISQRDGSQYGSLFSDESYSPVPNVKDFTRDEKLIAEYKLLGFLCGYHPIVMWNRYLGNRGKLRAADLHKYAGRRVRLAAWMVTRKAVITSKGNPMEFVSFEDETGIFETVLFPEIFSNFTNLIEEDCPYYVTGDIENQKGAIVMNVVNVEKLPRIF